MDPSSLPETTTPSVGELSADFAKQKRAKSPPLAFEKTSNDSLAPLTSPGTQTGPLTDSTSAVMGRLSPLRQGEELDLQVVVDQQAAAMQLLHDAFAAERQAWSLEKDRLYHRIASLEKLLRNGDGDSPAKSPVLSPTSGNITSPPRASSHAGRLPSIAEDEPIPTLSERRDRGSQSIEMPPPPVVRFGNENAIASEQDTPNASMVQEIAVSPPYAGNLSPPPLFNRMEAGHTPLKAPRPLTPPPKNISMDGMTDTPTRDNTLQNGFLSDEDKELTGPLNMPELPNQMDDTNFTLEALSKRLERIEQNPDESTPFAVSSRDRSPLSPPPERQGSDPATEPDISIADHPLSPAPTRVQDLSASELSSKPRTPSATLSPLAKHASREEQEEEQVYADFENGGIKLKKRPSTNFGAPFGSLAGNWRRPSHDRS